MPHFVSLHLGHVEIDEMWTFVAKKQARLTVDEKALRHDIGDVYLWYGIDQETMLTRPSSWASGRPTTPGGSCGRWPAAWRSRIPTPAMPTAT